MFIVGRDVEMMIHGLTVISIAVTLRRGAQLGPLGRVVLELVLEGEGWLF